MPYYYFITHEINTITIKRQIIFSFHKTLHPWLLESTVGNPDKTLETLVFNVLYYYY